MLQTSCRHFVVIARLRFPPWFSGAATRPQAHTEAASILGGQELILDASSFLFEARRAFGEILPYPCRGELNLATILVRVALGSGGQPIPAWWGIEGIR